MASGDLKSNDEIESALRTFEFLISRRGRRRM
jgi:ribosomal protein S21